MAKKSELIWVIVLFALVAGLSLAFQKPLTYHAGQGWDGVSYVQMAQQLAHHERPSAIGPFAFRLGTPALVAWLFPNTLLLGFRLVNLAACLLSVILLTLWLRRFVESPWLRLTLIGGYLTQWHAPLRFTAHYAAYTDPWLFVFLLAGLLALPPSRSISTFRRMRGGWGFVFLCFVGALFRESAVVVPLAVAIASRGRVWLPLLAGMLGVVATHALASQTDGYSFARTVGQWAYNKPLPVYIHGLFIAFGPALVLPLFFGRTALAWLKQQPVLTWILTIFLVLSWVGGSDTERIVYWAMPLVYALFGVILEKHTLPKRFYLVLGGLQLLSHRIFWTLPDFPSAAHSPLPLFTPLTRACSYPDLWSFQANRTTQVIALTEYVLVTVSLWLWLRYSPSRGQEKK